MFGLFIFLAVLAVLSMVSTYFLPDNWRKWPRLGAGILAVLSVVCLGFASFTQVAPSHIGIVTTFGKIGGETLSEGPHFILPISKVHQVFTGIDVAEAKNAEAGSRDLQSVHSTLTVNYRTDPGKAKDLFVLNPTLAYEQSYVIPATYEVFKGIVSHYTAEELVTKRQEVSGAISKALNAKLAPYYLTVQSVNLVNFGFSKAFDAAIEEKVTASQKAETAKRNLERVKFEAESRIAQAEGEAKAISIQAAAVEKQGGTGYVQLQAIAKWDGKLPTQMLGSAPVPFVAVAGASPAASAAKPAAK
jgi:prohibitin 2